MTTETLPLAEVRGPSAFGGGWRRFVHLTWVISRTDYKLTYFGSILGYFWSFMQPLLFFGVLYVVFAVIITTLSKGVKDFPVLLLMNIVLFTFFQQSTTGSVSSIVIREAIVRKMHFPRLVIPLATVTTSAINLVFNLVVVLLFMLFYGVTPRWSWLGLPLILVALFTLVTGLAMLLSSLYVRYRDVAPIWSVITQALYFACPVFITINSILPHGQTAHALLPLQPAGDDSPAGAPLDDRRPQRWPQPRDIHGWRGLAAGAIGVDRRDLGARLLGLQQGGAAGRRGAIGDAGLRARDASRAPARRRRQPRTPGPAGRSRARHARSARPSDSGGPPRARPSRSGRAARGRSPGARAAPPSGSEAAVSRQFSPSRSSQRVAGLTFETVAIPDAMNSNG